MRKRIRYSLTPTLISLILVISPLSARNGEINVKSLLLEDNSDPIEEVMANVTEIIELYRSIDRTRSRGAAWRYNIFQPLLTENTEVAVSGEIESAAGEANHFSLTGIFIGERGNSALINGRMVAEGEMISGMKVINISIDRVILGSSEYRRVLDLNGE